MPDKTSIASWYNEIKACNVAEIDAYKEKAKTPTGYFTQVVLAETLVLDVEEQVFVGCKKMGQKSFRYYVQINPLAFILYLGKALAMGIDTTLNQQRRRCRRLLIDSAEEQDQSQQEKSKPMTAQNTGNTHLPVCAVEDKN
ncbi:hypothetical protein ILUMI_24680 [Ignelater luminosus]|uniref:Uncharacterized protein n=1 Tax=Ignelater luminosus TaxID=2038154 RepID=A0A8K0CC21_IGNLU|nr:hypothetical protein ILUMI_24680 [Ignelater luminosus]